MNHKLGMAFAITIGAFALHCTTSHMGGGNGHGGDGGMVGDARADGGGGGACCTVTPQTFTTIAQGDITLGSSGQWASPAVDVSQYRELVVGYTQTGNCDAFDPAIWFQEPNTTAWIAAEGMGRVQVQGPSAQITVLTNNVNACTGTAHYIIAGVSLN
ncbi:MAG TPA: hypothetical protein VLX92_26070 [Kofleriaceae bacterium]|nr:hypothetical protein [Kofleriaceae bacterium]